MFGKNLQHYRLKHGLTKKALAAQCGLSAVAISNYENGKRKPESMDIIQRLAAALDVSVIEFLSPWHALEIAHGEFRRQSGCSGAMQDYVRSAVEEYLSRFYAVIDILGEMVLPEPPECHMLAMSRDIEENALRLRKHLRFATLGPVGKLIERLENIGIIVFFIEFPEGAKFSGMNGMVNGRPYIVLNQSMKPGAMRSTIAHELAHLMFDWTEFDGDVENTATAIGGAFLFPADDLRRELGLRRNGITKDMLMSCTEYGVSFMLLGKRAQACNIVSEASAKAFFINANRYGWRKDDPAIVAEETPTLFEQLVYRAVSQDEISMQKGAELLQRPIEEVEAKCLFEGTA